MVGPLMHDRIIGALELCCRRFGSLSHCCSGRTAFARTSERRLGRPTQLLLQVSSEMAFGKGTARSRLQVFLEPDRALRVSKRDGNNHLPWDSISRVRR